MVREEELQTSWKAVSVNQPQCTVSPGDECFCSVTRSAVRPGLCQKLEANRHRHNNTLFARSPPLDSTSAILLRNFNQTPSRQRCTAFHFSTEQIRQEKANRGAPRALAFPGHNHQHHGCGALQLTGCPCPIPSTAAGTYPSPRSLAGAQALLPALWGCPEPAGHTWGANLGPHTQQKQCRASTLPASRQRLSSSSSCSSRANPCRLRGYN